MSRSAALSAFPTTRVLVMGDVMLDEYVWGEVSRISPEAPVPVVAVTRVTHVPGGAANTAAGIAALGAHAVLGGVVGADTHAERLLEALARVGVDCDGVIRDATRVTTTKTRVIAHNQQVVRTDAEDRAPLSPALESALIAWVEQQAAHVDALVVSDYAKGVVSAAVGRAVIDLARRHGKPVVVDPKGVDYAKYRGATVVTPNVHEASRAVNVEVNGHADVIEIGRRLRAVLDGSAILVTRGADGMLLLADDRPVEIAAEARDVFDVTGAGDTVVAVIALALGCSTALEEAVRLANAAAGVAVGKVGTAIVTLDELGEPTS